MKLRIGRRFLVHRRKDVSGVSGTGYVAEGIEFHDGEIVVSWFGKQHIFECPQNLKTWLKVHGHGGATTIKWIDKKCSTTITSLKPRKDGCSKKAKK